MAWDNQVLTNCWLSLLRNLSKVSSKSVKRSVVVRLFLFRILDTIS
jgi:hypothetical protein